VDQVAVAVDHDVAVVAVLDLEQEAGDRVPVAEPSVSLLPGANSTIVRGRQANTTLASIVLGHGRQVALSEREEPWDSTAPG
jgi:hypothetical protein